MVNTATVAWLAVAASLAAAVPWSPAAADNAAAPPVEVSGADEIEPDPHGVVLTLPEGGPHRLWVADRLFRHSVLFDGDSGAALGMVDVALNLAGATPLVSHERGELYVIDPVYSRAHRGTRTDYITVYDASTLAVSGEIELPTRSADVAHGTALSALLDGGRFLVVLNQTPASSVTIVDVLARRFVAEAPTAGCALVYPVGPRSFGMLCGDGSAARVTFDDSGKEAALTRGQPFFDPVLDPLTEKGVRDGDRWLFASFDGYLHAVDFGSLEPSLADRWPLIEDAARNDDWRIGGAQHLALHRPSRRLYSLVHRGGPGSHKDPGSEIWVYDVERRERVQRIEPPSLVPGSLRPLLDIEPGSLTDRILGWLMPNPGVHSIAVSQDDRPLLFARNNDLAAVAVLDALTGRHLRDIEESGFGGGAISVP